jgi:FtsP/CotA-like multicopper oxidase with cupredoxin domain
MSLFMLVVSALMLPPQSPVAPSTPPPGSLPAALPNDNRTGAGTLSNGVLTLRLVVQWTSWTMNSMTARELPMLAFAEEGKAPTMPGPVLRVPKGTLVRASVKNPLPDLTIVVRGLTSHATDARDSLVVAPGATVEREFVAEEEGTYFYWATISGATIPQRRFGHDSQLNGAFIIDGPLSARNDRIFLITLFSDSAQPNGNFRIDRQFWSINGRAWPETERLEYTLGDSITWRVINPSADIHPMHLHGFYYRVDARGANGRDTLYEPHQRRMVVTEKVNPGTTMQMTWSPDRPGGWIFHCHFTGHLQPHGKLNGQPDPSHDHADPQRHTEQGMSGLIIAMQVRDTTARSPASTAARRQLRLIINSDSTVERGRRFAFVEQKDGKEPARDSLPVPGSRLVLHRDEPTTITVVNRSGEPASIHWHGIELDSYYDGVVGIGGMAGSRTPAIMPADSFKVRMTAPRSGSFMYHTHFDDFRQTVRGLYAPLTVLEPGQNLDEERDISLMIGNAPPLLVVLNGSRTPAPRTMQVGQTYRVRIANITAVNPNLFVHLVREGTPVPWRPIAKDGFDLPTSQATIRTGRQPVSNGEIYDFEVIPAAAGDMTFEVRGGAGALLVSLPIRVIP